MHLLEYNSFRELLVSEKIRSPTFDTNLTAMEAVELMSMICDLGDQVLKLSQNARIAAEDARSLLLELMNCFTNPTSQSKRVLEMAKEIREHEI